MFYDLLLAERTGSLVQQPPLYAINVIIVLARQLADFLAFADIVVTTEHTYSEPLAFVLTILLNCSSVIPLDTLPIFSSN